MCVTHLEPLVDHRPAKKKRFEKRMNACGGEGVRYTVPSQIIQFTICMQFSSI